MVNISLAKSYYGRAKIRAEILNEFMKRKDFADVVREAQEIVELIQKALLMIVGITPPKWHDVSDIIIENIESFPESIRDDLKELRKDSKWLRSHREISFYGTMDLIPEDFYTEREAEKAMNLVKKYLKIADYVFEKI